mgnify:CR=1 FL=1
MLTKQFCILGELGLEQREALLVPNWARERVLQRVGVGLELGDIEGTRGKYVQEPLDWCGMEVE